MNKKYDREKALEQLYEKMLKEFNAYKEYLLKTPSVLVENPYAAYELIYKQDIVSCFEEDSGSFHDNDIQFLVSKDKPLRWIYTKWLERSENHMRMIRSFIRDSIILSRFSSKFDTTM